MNVNPDKAGPKRATTRPAHVKAPPEWTNPPVPAPKQVEFVPPAHEDRPEPVRYGDWEKNGIAIDF